MTDATLWRITRSPLADLSGEGARLFGGRWNPVGVPCVYTCTSLSLAVLEVLVHTDPDLVPDDLVAVRIHVTDAADEVLGEASLPPRWRVEIGNADTQAFGGTWARDLRTPLLVLPTALLPAAAQTPERNVLINPLHPAAAATQITDRIPFSFDARLVQG